MKADGAGAPGMAGAVYVDLSDVLRYLRFHTVVSGIQRVIAEVVPHLDTLVPCRFVTYSVERGEFVLLDRDRIVSLLELVRHANEQTKERTRAEVEAVLATVEGATAHEGRPGDALVILGAGWAQPGLFKAVQGLKAQGSAAVVLVYDLIPVLYPGFSEAMIHEFRQYVPRVAYLADRVPTISDATRRDFEGYCRAHGWPVPGGRTTRLAGDQWTQERLTELRIAEDFAWERPFVLLVSTVESRKNHIFAFRAWQRLVALHGPDAVADLVCVGRLGWNVYEFLEEMHVTQGLDGRVHVLHESVSDAALAALYRDCLFTVYPSKYEGWGLPIAESLEWRKPVVSARNSSLEEVGLGLVTYFEDGDLDAFVDAVGTLMLDPEARRSAAARIEGEYLPPSWFDVATVLADECRQAVAVQSVARFEIQLGAEYGLGLLPAFTDTVTGEAVVEFLDRERRLPLTGQYLGVERSFLAEMFTSTQRTLGGTRITIDFARPTSGDLNLVVSTVEGPREWDVRVAEPRGIPRSRLVAGEAFAIAVGSGRVGEAARAVIEVRGTTEDALRSFVVVTSNAEAEAMVARNLVRLVNRRSRPSTGAMGDSQAAEALQMVMSSTSWRITRPLREGKALAERARRRRRTRS